MATKKTPLTDDDLMPSLDDAGDLDNAIGGLRDVLKSDAEGSLSSFGDFGDFDAADESPMAMGGRSRCLGGAAESDFFRSAAAW